MVISIIVFSILILRQGFEVYKLKLWKKGINYYRQQIKFSRLVIQYIILCVGIISVCIYLKLDINTYILLGLNGMMGFTLVVDWTIKFYQNEAQFNETTLFMMHLSSFFKTTKKTSHALQECSKMMGNKTWIQQLIISNQEGKDLMNSDIPLPKHYLLKSIFTIMDNTEKYGSDTALISLQYLDIDVDRMIEQTHYDIQERIKLKDKLLMLIVLTIGVALTSYWLLNGVVDVHTLSLFQGIMSAFFQLMLFTSVWSFRLLAQPWFLKEEYV